LNVFETVIGSYLYFERLVEIKIGWMFCCSAVQKPLLWHCIYYIERFSKTPILSLYEADRNILSKAARKAFCLNCGRAMPVFRGIDVHS